MSEVVQYSTELLNRFPHVPVFELVVHITIRGERQKSMHSWSLPSLSLAARLVTASIGNRVSKWLVTTVVDSKTNETLLRFC